MKNHNLTEDFSPREIVVAKRPVLDKDGAPVDGLHNVWITLNNPKEHNSYTTGMAKEIILALREASNDRAAVAVVLTRAKVAAQSVITEPSHPIERISSSCARLAALVGPADVVSKASEDDGGVDAFRVGTFCWTTC